MTFRRSSRRTVSKKLNQMFRNGHPEQSEPAGSAIDLGCEEPQDLGELLKVVVLKAWKDLSPLCLSAFAQATCDLTSTAKGSLDMVHPARNRRKQLTSKPLAGVAEVCETRALLCAACGTIPVDVAGLSEPQFEDTTDDSVNVKLSSEEAATFGKEIATCEMIEGATGEYFCVLYATDVEVPMESMDGPGVYGVDFIADEAVLTEEGSETYLEYPEDGMPLDWNPSWGYRSLSIEPTSIDDAAMTTDVTLTDEAVPTGDLFYEYVEDGALLDPIDVTIFESIKLPMDCELPEDVNTLDATLNPDDLMVVACFGVTPEDVSAVRFTVESKDGEGLLEDAVIYAEDPNAEYPVFIPTMVMRGSVSEGDVESTEVVEETGLVEITAEDEEIWQTFLSGVGEELPEDHFYLAYSSMPGESVPGELEERTEDVVDFDGELTENLEDMPVVYFGTTSIDENTELPSEDVFVTFEESTTDDELVMEIEDVEDPSVIFQSMAGGEAPSTPESPTEDTGSPVNNQRGPNASRRMFASTSDSSDSVGTLLTRPTNGPVVGNGIAKQTSSATMRSSGRLRPASAPKTTTGPEIGGLTPLLGSVNDQASETTDDSESDVPASENGTTNDDAQTSTSQASQQESATVAGQPQRHHSIDLFMSRFHNESYAS